MEKECELEWNVHRSKRSKLAHVGEGADSGVDGGHQLQVHGTLGGETQLLHEHDWLVFQPMEVATANCLPETTSPPTNHEAVEPHGATQCSIKRRQVFISADLPRGDGKDPADMLPAVTVEIQYHCVLLRAAEHGDTTTLAWHIKGTNIRTRAAIYGTGPQITRPCPPPEPQATPAPDDAAAEPTCPPLQEFLESVYTQFRAKGLYCFLDDICDTPVHDPMCHAGTAHGAACSINIINGGNELPGPSRQGSVSHVPDGSTAGVQDGSPDTVLLLPLAEAVEALVSSTGHEVVPATSTGAQLAVPEPAVPTLSASSIPSVSANTSNIVNDNNSHAADREEEAEDANVPPRMVDVGEPLADLPDVQTIMDRHPGKSINAAQRQRTQMIKLQHIARYFPFTIEAAAGHLQICPTVLKRLCRRFGVNRWPNRKLTSLRERIVALEDCLLKQKEAGQEPDAMLLKELETHRLAEASILNGTSMFIKGG
eukprot:jgi/Mesvir1/15236/Mv06461-RA.1